MIEVEARSRCCLGSLAKKWSYVDACIPEFRRQICEVLKGLTSAHEMSCDEFWAVCNQDGVVTALAIDRSDADPRIHKVVGMAMMFIHKKFSRSTCYVEDVVVDPKYRGQKIGERLMDKLFEIAQYLKIKSIDLSSGNKPERVAAQKLYLKLGFEKRDSALFRKKL